MQWSLQHRVDDAYSFACAHLPVLRQILVPLLGIQQEHASYLQHVRLLLPVLAEHQRHRLLDEPGWLTGLFLMSGLCA